MRLRSRHVFSSMSSLVRGRQPFSSSPSSTLRVGVVGTGRMGKIRLQSIQTDPRLCLSAIIDPSLSSKEAKELENLYGAKVYESVNKQALDGLDGIWIATPTPTHGEIIHQCTTTASSQFRAIGIEKPVGATLEEIDQAYASCHAKGIDLFCSFQRRFDPSYQSLANSTRNAEIGDLQSIHTVFRDHPCPPIEFLKTGGDPFHDLAVHDIDFVCTLLNEYPTRVYAYGTSLSEELRQVQVMDKASVWLEFDGVICTMDLSRRADYGYDQRIEVAGEKGMLQVQNPIKTSVVRSRMEGIVSDTLLYSFPQRFEQAYRLEMDHFIEVLSKKTSPRVTWTQARMATIISEAARLSAVHRKVVTFKYTKSKNHNTSGQPSLQVQYKY